MGLPVTVGSTGGQLSQVNPGTNTPYVPVGTMSYASDNVAVASVNPTSGTVASVGNGNCSLSGTDSGNGATDSLVCTVTLAAGGGFNLVLTPNAAAPRPR
jgi:hypothetical protein